MLILKIVALGRAWPTGISPYPPISQEVLQVRKARSTPLCPPGNEDGFAAEWGESEKGRRGQFYKYRRRGRKQLARRGIELERLGRSGGHILQTWNRVCHVLWNPFFPSGRPMSNDSELRFHV